MSKDNQPGVGKDLADPTPEQAIDKKGVSRRDFLHSGGKAAYVAPALFLLSPTTVMGQIGSPPCDLNDPLCNASQSESVNTRTESRRNPRGKKRD